VKHGKSLQNAQFSQACFVRNMITIYEYTRYLHCKRI